MGFLDKIKAKLHSDDKGESDAPSASSHTSRFVAAVPAANSLPSRHVTRVISFFLVAHNLASPDLLLLHRRRRRWVPVRSSHERRPCC